MSQKLLLFACNITTFLTVSLHAQVIYHEAFNTQGLGIRGSLNGLPITDTTGASWYLSCPNCSFTDETDYAKTVATSGGRFEVLDNDGEARWLSPLINISTFPMVSITLDAGETGSSASPDKKYLRAAFLIDGLYVPFAPDSMVAGNWGSTELRMDSVKGSLLQVIVVMNSSYANDKVYLDNVLVKGYSIEKQEEAFPFDVIFNEIMADPTPTAGLPEVEYIELYNRSNKLISIEGWVLTCKNTSKLLPTQKIPPGNYVLLCSPTDTAKLSIYGAVLPVKSFPALINSGAALILTGYSGIVIDSIAYSDYWYHDEAKKKGGWSLERIDPNRQCGQNNNWTASVGLLGGTPGSLNSVWKKNQDTIPPEVTAIKALSAYEISLSFSETLMANSFESPGNIKITDGLHYDSLVYQNDVSVLNIKLNERMKANTPYHIIIDQLSDECGNSTLNSESNFIWTYIEPGNILLSEILFNPKPGGADFVEIYNPGVISFDLSGLLLANRNDSLKWASVCRIAENQLFIEPKSFVALSTAPEKVVGYYYIPYPDRLIQTKLLPAYPDNNGSVVLLNDSLQVVDEMHYNDSMHSPFINNTEGVSLERSSMSITASDQTNWHSSSSLSGFATPGYQNSQPENPVPDAPILDLSNNFISPNGDGYNDQLQIRIRTDRPGYLANIMIFNTEGRIIKQIANNLLINTND